MVIQATFYNRLYTLFEGIFPMRCGHIPVS